MLQKFALGRNKERGQSFMELAISLTFLLILLSVLIDLGWAFYELISLRDTVQEAAAYGSMCPNDFTLIENRLKQTAYAPIDVNGIAAITIDYVDNLGNPVPLFDRGDSIRISITYEHRMIVPFVETFIGTDRYPLTVTVADTILRLENTGCQ